MPDFSLPTRVTVSEAGAVVSRALAALRAGDASQPWTVDASALQTFDSSCLALLLELRRHAASRSLRVLDAPPRLAHLATAYGLDFALVDIAVPATHA